MLLNLLYNVFYEVFFHQLTSVVPNRCLLKHTLNGGLIERGLPTVVK